jgi:catechol 2,3-dioxygenase-like lactoylglutathione lyase family enzyme
MRSQTVHRWYARPVFFVAELNRAIRFYVDVLGFEKGWRMDSPTFGVNSSSTTFRPRKSGGDPTPSKCMIRTGMNYSFR